MRHEKPSNSGDTSRGYVYVVVSLVEGVGDGLGVFVVVGFGVLEGVGEGLAVEGVLTSSHPASCGQSQTSNSLLKWRPSGQSNSTFFPLSHL
jgi:hypothetical protein